jgi:hypothetical protein
MPAGRSAARSGSELQQHRTSSPTEAICVNTDKHHYRRELLRHVVLELPIKQWCIELYIQLEVAVHRQATPSAELEGKMDQTIAIVLGLTFAQIVTSAQENSETELARLLLNEATQERTVESLVASPDKVRLALLLSWTKDPPRQLNIVERAELYIGMTEVFGRLRTTTAIPFLIENISLQLPATPNVWTKTAGSIEERVPAVAALIAIGPDAAKALIHAPRAPRLMRPACGNFVDGASEACLTSIRNLPCTASIQSQNGFYGPVELSVQISSGGTIVLELLNQVIVLVRDQTYGGMVPKSGMIKRRCFQSTLGMRLRGNGVVSVSGD